MNLSKTSAVANYLRIASSVFGLLLALEGYAQDLQAPQHTTDLTKLSNAELIDQLATTSDFGPGYHGTAFVNGFLGDDNAFEFGGGIIGSEEPQVHPAMKELVRRGSQSLPTLVEHLSDSRRTDLLVSASGFAGGTWHSDEYDPRYSAFERQPPNVNTAKEVPLEKPYNIKIGDLCYVTIGQIVNRNLLCLRYQPSGCYVINSPIEAPALAEAVKRDWANLTSDEHRSSLIADAYSFGMDHSSDAIRRLAVYYPSTVDNIIIELLNRSLYDPFMVQDFIDDTLLQLADGSDWRAAIAAFELKHGKAIAETIPWFLDGYCRNKSQYDIDSPEVKTAGQILRAIYPAFSSDARAQLEVASIREQHWIIKAALNVKSKAVDDAIHETFLKAQAFNPNDWSVEDIAELAVSRITVASQKLEYSRYFEAKIEEMRKRIKESESDLGLVQRLEESISRLQKFLDMSQR